MVMYSTDFDFELNDFPLNLWGVDVWFIRALSEFQIMVVTSWENLATRVVFAMSMISNMNSLKQILSCMNWKVKASISKRPQLCSVHPFSPTKAKENVGGNLVRLQTVVTAESKLARVVFFVWGAVILTLHLYAESIHGLSVCIVQVKPWLSSQPSCSMVVLDCYKGGFGGTFHEVNTQWKELDPTVPVAITVCHCNNLEMPSILQKFSALKMLKFYNTTITNWNESASLTQVHHPNLMMLYMSRVNMTGGQLPVALQGENLPKKIIDIEFCVTNLRTLPDDFDQKWPQYASIYFEAGNFTEVPASLIRLAPYDLSLAFNPIPSIPAVLFESTIEFLNIGGTLISELPKSVRDSSSLEQLRVYDTNISFFWDWIDPILENAGSVLSDIPTTIVASRNPFCLDLQRIYIGEQTSFSVQYRKGYSELLSNASVENWETLRRAVSCGECSALYYTLEMDDMQYGVQATLEP
ncbi:unnamed protein product [Phytophthora lilii]|uniref:Unnamed protein product n=1 Tax=Phytophthora lilii TaxID=2077276 RepID=A0A9W6YJX3_9STRA|nr:unnamed protein product [Phytophthora lilii]